jgi:hypothetical protein
MLPRPGYVPYKAGGAAPSPSTGADLFSDRHSANEPKRLNWTEIRRLGRIVLYGVLGNVLSGASGNSSHPGAEESGTRGFT